MGWLRELWTAYVLTRPSDFAASWEQEALEWDEVGHYRRAAQCRKHADFWRLPFWRRFWTDPPAFPGDIFPSDIDTSDT